MYPQISDSKGDTAPQANARASSSSRTRLWCPKHFWQKGIPKLRKNSVFATPAIPSRVTATRKVATGFPSISRYVLWIYTTIIISSVYNTVSLSLRYLLIACSKFLKLPASKAFGFWIKVFLMFQNLVDRPFYFNYFGRITDSNAIWRNIFSYN